MMKRIPNLSFHQVFVFGLDYHEKEQPITLRFTILSESKNPLVFPKIFFHPNESRSSYLTLFQAGIMCLGSTLISLPSDTPFDTASFGWYQVTLPSEEETEGKEMEELLHTLTDKSTTSEGGKKE